MDIANARCPDCKQSLKISRMTCPACKMTMDGDFEVSSLGRLSPEDQSFVIAFVRHHGSIKKMEAIFDISYPTVKNRLNAIGAALDLSIESPSSNLFVLEQLSRGEISVDEALEKMN